MLELYFWIILITFISGVVGTGLGGLIGVLLGNGSNKSISLLLSFAAGVMLSIVCFELIPESIAPEGLIDNIYIFLTVLFGQPSFALPLGKMLEGAIKLPSYRDLEFLRFVP